MASAERKTPALRVNMKRAAHAFLTNANLAKFGKTVNVSLKNALMVKIRSMANVPINANVKKALNNGLKGRVVIKQPSAMMVVSLI